MMFYFIKIRNKRNGCLKLKGKKKKAVWSRIDLSIDLTIMLHSNFFEIKSIWSQNKRRKEHSKREHQRIRKILTTNHRIRERTRQKKENKQTQTHHHGSS